MPDALMHWLNSGLSTLWKLSEQKINDRRKESCTAVS